MPSYLLAWNPQRWEWIELAKMSQQVRDGKHTTIRWSCGNSRRIMVDDRVFFICRRNLPYSIEEIQAILKQMSEK